MENQGEAIRIEGWEIEALAGREDRREPAHGRGVRGHVGGFVRRHARNRLHQVRHRFLKEGVSGTRTGSRNGKEEPSGKRSATIEKGYVR